MEKEVLHLTSDKWKHWHYKNTGLLVLSLVFFILFADTPIITNVVSHIGNLGYVGAFIAGIMFASVFTIAPASVVLFYLAESLNPLGIAVVAGTGCLAGDYLILRYLKDRVFKELEPVFMNHGGRHLSKLFRTPYFALAVPILGAIVVMSPFPDEVGIGLLGISKMKTWQLLGLLWLLDIIGVFLIVIAAKSF